MPCLKAFVVGLALWVFEDLGLEERIVGIGCLVEELRPLRMEFEGILEEFQGIIDLGIAGLEAGQHGGGRSATHLDVLCSVDLFVDVLFGLDVDGREGGLQMDRSVAVREDRESSVVYHLCG